MNHFNHQAGMQNCSSSPIKGFENLWVTTLTSMFNKENDHQLTDYQNNSYL